MNDEIIKSAATAVAIEHMRRFEQRQRLMDRMKNPPKSRMVRVAAMIATFVNRTRQP